MKKRKGDWLITYTGKRFYPIDPRSDDVDIKDIARSLSMITRYLGHSEQFYSVAEHSVMISKLFSDPIRAMFALLHDGHEAYTGDFISPLKNSNFLLRWWIKRIQTRIDECIYEKFKLRIPPHLKRAILAEIKEIDHYIVPYEMKWIMNQNTYTGQLDRYDRYCQHPMINIWMTVQTWPQGTAERQFLNRFYYLEREFNRAVILQFSNKRVT